MMAAGAMRVRHGGGCCGLPTTGVYCPTVTLVGHQVGQQKCPPLLVLSDLSDLSDLLKKEHAALPQSAAHAAGVANPTVRIRVPSGTEYFVGGEVTAPKKHTT